MYILSTFNNSKSRHVECNEPALITSSLPPSSSPSSPPTHKQNGGYNLSVSTTGTEVLGVTVL